MRKSQKQQQAFTLKTIRPKTENQERAFKEYNTGKNLMLHGVAGTGKTYISLYLALKETFAKDSLYHSVVIVRSVVPSRDMGFLPGSVKEKAKIYEEPYRAICNELYDRGDAYDILKHHEQVMFVTTSHLRGTTFKDSIIIVDEFSNMCFSELDTIITRMGDNCRLIFCGDVRQSDLQREYELRGVENFIRIIDKVENFTKIEFGVDDIVRSQLVKSYIIAKLEANIYT